MVSALNHLIPTIIHKWAVYSFWVKIQVQFHICDIDLLRYSLCVKKTVLHKTTLIQDGIMMGSSTFRCHPCPKTVLPYLKQFLFFLYSVIKLSAGTARDGPPGKLPESLEVKKTTTKKNTLMKIWNWVYTVKIWAWQTLDNNTI